MYFSKEEMAKSKIVANKLGLVETTAYMMFFGYYQQKLYNLENHKTTILSTVTKATTFVNYTICCFFFFYLQCCLTAILGPQN